MRKATIEEDKAVVTPDMKKDPVSTAAQPSNDLAKSETLPDSNVENSESQPSKDLSNSESNPNKELPSDTLATSGDTGTLPNHELDNSKEPVDSESPPSKDLSNSESKPDKELPSDTLATSGDTGTLPNHELDNSKEPVHSESQPSKDLSNSESKPDKELPSDTLATSGDTETLPNHELDNSQEPPNDHPENSESSGNAEASQNIKSVNFDIPPSSNAPSDQKASEPSYRLLNSEALPNNNAGNSEIQTNNEMLVSETQCSNEVVMSETRQSNDVVVSETQQSKEVVVSETQQSNDVVVSETQQSNEVAVSETRLSNEEAVSETRQSNEVAVSETRQSKEVVMSETQQRNEVVTKPSNEVVMPETQPSNEANMPETQTCDNAVTQPSNEVVEPETQQSNEVVMQPSNEMVISDTQPSNETNMPETQTCDDVVMQRSNEVVEPETQQSYEVVTQRSNEVVEPETQQIYEMATQPSNEVVMSDTQLGNEANMPETQTCDDVVMSEAIPENELGNPITDPNNQLCHSEMLHDNQFANFHMIPEDQLPQPESLPHSEPPPNSEPLADNHLTDIKPVPHNHLAHYETVPNNHLNHSEAFSNNHLANSESLSHDQLANSQILTHYELENNEAMHNNQLVNSQAHYELAISNALPSYEIINAETPLNNEERTPETQPSKRRKKKSIVWEHFTIDTISPGCRRARCNQCDQTFAYSTGSKVAGTSHLKRHIAKGTCSAILRSQEHNQLNPYTPRTRGSGACNASDPPKRRYRSPSTPYIIFDQDHCRHEIARMIIMHDYPLHMVEHPGFVAFVQNLQPQFKMVTFNTIQGDCVATYLVEKGNLMKYFEGLPGRVCLTLDIWSSSQSLGYVFITGHFVDNDWKLQRRILNVVMEPYPDSDSALSHAVAVCLSDWGLEGRLFSVTCNRSMNEVALENLRPLLSVKNTLILNGQFLVGNCIARTLSSVAKDLLGSAQDLINKIRDSVKYVKTSESHEEKFLELKQQLQVPSERSLFIDDQIQWNTTYQMLIAASELKEVFSCLDTSDPDYKGAPSMQDWKLVETLCAYLKPLFDAANILTTATHPTAVTFFHEVWKLQLDVGRAVMSEDPFISNLNKIMHEKIDKYWRDCSLVLALAVVMDPRFKMKLVEFSFTKIHGEDAHMYIKIVDDGIHELFHEYVTLPLPLTPAYAEDGSAGRHSKMHESQGGTLLSDNGLTDFDAYIMETTNQQMKSELDQYLEESLLPRVPDFDVLGWWKLNKVKYPTLSKMARDILTVPVSTVPPDSVFYTKSKEMDHYRCSLRPETVEALVCAKDWMQYGAAEASNALVKMVF